MPYFPQLVTSSVAQYPLRKERSSRTILNQTIEGRNTKYQDAGETSIRWDLVLSSLTAAERNALEDLFQESEGRLRSFVFADPLRNLLARSEEFTETPWQNDPLLQWTSGLADPVGGTNAYRVVNSGAGAQTVGQTLELPGNYHCCFSIHARAGSPATIAVARSAGGLQQSWSFAVTPDWKRISVSGRVPSAVAPSRFEITIAGGDTVELFGAQVDAQPIAAPYGRTGSSTGVHTSARFAQDELPVVAESIDSFATRITIVSPGEGF